VARVKSRCTEPTPRHPPGAFHSLARSLITYALVFKLFYVPARSPPAVCVQISRAVCLRATVKVQPQTFILVHQLLSRQSRRGGKFHRDALCMRARCIANRSIVLGGRDFCIFPLNYSSVGDSFCALPKAILKVSLSSFKLRLIIMLILYFTILWHLFNF
jgi:hypothetical protein